MRILIVEDDEKLSHALKKGLELMAYAVDVVMDGETALRRIEANHGDYDLAILDLNLPKMNGFEVCTAVREKGISLPILILTGQDSAEDKVKGLNIGADDYLTKPFSISELEARIRALLRRPKDVTPTLLECKDLTLDLASRKLYRRNHEILLSLKEFGILEYLIRNCNQVVQREQILSHVWDFEFNSFSNIIDVHIANLRKKIRTPGNDYIETVRGVGYRLNSDS